MQKRGRERNCVVVLQRKRQGKMLNYQLYLIFTTGIPICRGLQFFEKTVDISLFVRQKIEVVILHMYICREEEKKTRV